MSIKNSFEQLKYGFLVSSLFSIAIIAVPLYVVFLLGASYASLLGINYVLTTYPGIGLTQFAINVYHVIGFSILLAVIFRPSRSSQSIDKQTEDWVTSNLNIHFSKIDEVNERLDKLDDIKDYLTEINSTLERISDEKNV